MIIGQRNRAFIIEHDHSIYELNSMLAEVPFGLVRVPFEFQLAPLLQCTVYTQFDQLDKPTVCKVSKNFENIEDVWKTGVDDVAVVGEAAMLHYAAGRFVVREGEGDDSFEVHRVEGVFQ